MASATQRSAGSGRCTSSRFGVLLLPQPHAWRFEEMSARGLNERDARPRVPTLHSVSPGVHCAPGLSLPAGDGRAVEPIFNGNQQ